MKKFLFFVSALAGLFLAASCQQENLEPVVEGGVTYTISLPETVQTKGQSGYDEYDLYYEVYRTADVTELQSANLLFEKKVEMQGNQTTLTLDLLNDQSYTILFWANKKGVDYFDLSDLRKVTVKQAASNNNDRDAFCGKDVLVDFDAADSKTVQLTRPFAQLNIATVVPTEDEIGYDITPKNSFVKVSNIPVTYNVSNGTVTGDTEVSFDKNTVPSGKKVMVNTDSYDLVAMNYVLVPAGNVSVYYEIETENGTVKNTINNVPLKVNYRTNIIGNLLTSNADYTVEILPGFATEEFYGPEFVQEPVYDSETKTYTVTNYYELLWVADQVNTGKKDFYGETVQIAADIDLENKPWTPIGTSTSVCFRGTFEGVAMSKADNGYPTIKNLYIENGNCSGFFTVLCNGGKVRNINFDGAKISGERQLGVVAGQIYGNLETPVVEYVTVENAQITAVPAYDGQYYDNGDKVGGIAGLVGQEAYVANCTVKNVTLKAYRDMGGIVGSTQNSYPSKLTDNTVEDLTFIVTSFYHDSYKPDNDGSIPEAGNYASIRGGRRSNANDTIENNTGDDITLHKVLAEETEGGIYDSETKTYTVTSPAGLENALSGSGAAGAGDHTIEIVGDLDMTGINWTPIKVDGYHGADIVTVEGNGATITGLDGALFAGGFAGGSGIVIKDLTIKDANMIVDNTQGYGAFVNCADSMDEITLINCHLINSTIITPNDGAGESRIGGLVGWTSGWDKQSDGPVDSYITIKNCSVTGCTFKGAGTIGGLCGHAGANPATFTTIENCTVTENNLISTDDGDWRVGVAVGTANIGQCVINNITSSGNTLSQTGKTAPIWHTDLYGRFVPSSTGTLTIDGVAMSDVAPELVEGYTALYTKDGEYFVFDLDGLKDLHDFFKANHYANSTWGKTYNISADIDADGYTWEGIWMNTGSSTSNGLILNGNNHTIENLTIKDYMFAGNPTGTVEASTPGEVKNITMKNVTVNGSSHDATVFWGNCHGNVNFTNVTVDGARISGGSNVGALMSRTTLDGIDNIVVNFTDCKVINSTLKADNPNADPTGASGFIGRAYGATKLSFSGCSVENNTIINENGLVGGKVYGYTTYLDGFVGTGACDEFTDWGGLVYAAKVGTEVFGSITEAVENAKEGDTVTLISDLTLTETLALPAGIIFNGNGKQIEGTISANGDLTLEGHTKVTSFSAGFSGNTITIEEGACLEMTGTGRGTFGYANTFDIKGNVTDAKTADKSEIQPSLIIPGGISITGGNGFTLNLENAYIKIGNTSSKNSAANGTFTLNITNSIVDFTNQLTFSEPTNGNNPTFNLNIKDSKVTTAAKFCIAAPNTNVVIDNSIVMPGTYLRNSGSLTLKNDSELNAATIQFGESGGNNGTITVDNSKFTITTGNNKGHAYDGKGVGKIIAKNGAEVSVEHYKAMTIECDATSTFTGTEVL